MEADAERFRTHAAFEALMGRAPTLSDADAKAALRAHVAELEEEELDTSRRAVTDLMADTTFAVAAAVNVGANISEVKRVRATIGKEFFSLDSSRQAFVLLLLSDVLVGYHSAEGWATALELVSSHYGLEERKDLVSIFIAIVPVSLDVLFKFWCFKVRAWGACKRSGACVCVCCVFRVDVPAQGPDAVCVFSCVQSLRELSPDTQVILDDIDRH